MFKVAFLAAFVAFATTTMAADKKIVCYFSSWAVYRPGLGKFDISNLDPRLCTHMVYSVAGINIDGSVRVVDSWADLPNGLDGYGKFTRLRQLSPGTKAMIAIGGWNEGSTTFSLVAGDPVTRARFVQNVVNFLKQYNFDGLDLDWEYPNQRGGQPSDKENYVALLRELREAFNPHGYILSIAVAAAEYSASQSYNIRDLSQHVDFISLMTFDFNGSWNPNTGLNAPMNASSRESGPQAKLNMNSAVLYWLQQGAPGDKLVLGVPSYGRSFTLADPGNHGVGAPTTGPGAAGPYTRNAGSLGFNEICESLGQIGWIVIRDPEQQVPYAFKGNQWVGFDDAMCVEKKADYIKKMGLAGAMLWSVETDDFRGTCGQKYPLLKALNSALRGGVPPAPVNSNPGNPSPSSTAAPPPPPTSPPSGSVCKEEGYARDPNDCSTFYYCKNVGGQYKASTFHCAPGLAFDTSLNVCNHKESVPGC